MNNARWCSFPHACIGSVVHWAPPNQQGWDHPILVGSSVETYTFSYVFVRVYAQSAFINEIWPKFCYKMLGADFSELSWNLLSGGGWVVGWAVYYSATSICSGLVGICISVPL